MSKEENTDDRWGDFRSEFYLPDGKIYLDGNSLGLLSRRAESSLLNTLRKWRELGIDGWTDGEPAWIDLAAYLARLTAPLIGATEDSIVVANSVTVNLHQLLATFYHPTDAKSHILIDGCAFPTDRYVARSHIELHGRNSKHHLKIVQPRLDGLLDISEICECLTSEIAVAVLPSVVYTTGQLLDIQRIAAAAQSNEVVVVIDCSHTIGVVPHEFENWGVDSAVWCGYKYLNGGPGSTGGLYVNRKRHPFRPGLVGWFGVDKARQFDMADEPLFAGGAAAMQLGTPNILSMAPLIGSLEMVAEAGIVAIRNRSLELTKHLMELADSHLSQLGFTMVTPRASECRGGHVSLAHSEAILIAQAMKSAGIVSDFRHPNLIRLAPAPLYTGLAEITAAVQTIATLVRDKRYLAFSDFRELAP